MVLMRARIETYNSELNKNGIDLKPKLLLVMYGEVSLKQMLRLKLTYGLIEGLVVFDETFELKPWL